MPRVAALSPSVLPAGAAAVCERFTAGGRFADQAAVLAHVPPALEHLYAMIEALNTRAATPRRYIELGIVVASRLNACQYCVASHAPILAVEGLSQAAVDHLPEPGHPDMDEADNAVIAYAREVTLQAYRIDDALFDRLRGFLSEAQIVELTLRIALAGFFNRFNDALQIDDGRSAGVSAAGPASTSQGIER